MIESQINLKIVKDVTRILSETGGWKPSEPEDWHGRAKHIASLMNAGKEQDLIDRISQSLSDAEAEAEDPEAEECTKSSRLSGSYVRNTITLLKYRLEARAAGTKLPKIMYSPKDFLDGDDYCWMKRSLKSEGKVIIGYHAVELAGSAQQLQADLSERFEMPVSVTIADQNQGNAGFYREKNSFLGHKPWLIMPILPPVLVKLTQAT